MYQKERSEPGVVPPTRSGPSLSSSNHVRNHYRIQFPPKNAEDLDQDEITFFIIEDGQKTELRFHDYAEIYRRPGLYEQLFYDRLKCTSPRKVGDILKHTLDGTSEVPSELRVLDLGAGNGMMGEVMKEHGVARLIGADIIPEAREACIRDRPAVYDDYYVVDFTQLDDESAELLSSWSIDCLTTVAALGFDDIPPHAFLQALRFVKTGGWVAFNIKETFLDHSDTTGFSRLVRELIFSEYLDTYHIEKYRHRLSMEGTPLYYFALVARTRREIPPSILDDLGIRGE